MMSRSGRGSTQATYTGHPLYTYTADTAPGQANGNGINASGGVWHEVTVSGTAAPASSPSSVAGRVLTASPWSATAMAARCEPDRLQRGALRLTRVCALIALQGLKC